MATKTLPKIDWDDAWRADSLCLLLGMPTDWFYADEESKQYEFEEEVVPVCERCEVKDQCLDFALRTNEEFGIFGALKVVQRTRLKTKMRSEMPVLLMDIDKALDEVAKHLE